MSQIAGLKLPKSDFRLSNFEYTLTVHRHPTNCKRSPDVSNIYLNRQPIKMSVTEGCRPLISSPIGLGWGWGILQHRKLKRLFIAFYLLLFSQQKDFKEFTIVILYDMI